MDALDPDTRYVRSLHAIACGLTRLKWLRDATRFELAMRRHDRVLKYNFNPAQPRVPKKAPGAGEWTDTGAGQGRVRLAGEIPTGDSPEVPKTRPSTSAARTAVLKQIARRLGPLMTVAEAAWAVGSWVYEHHAKIDSYRDPPKSMEELRDAVSPTAKAGYQDHHIVEQTSAERDGKFSRDLIDSRDNVVRIPTMKHEDINAWYQRPNNAYGDLSPREYLRDKSWGERTAVGLKALKDAGVLKP